MKNKMKTAISYVMIITLLAVFFVGCGSTEITEVSESVPVSQQENHAEQGKDQEQGDKSVDAPEMEATEIPVGDIELLLQAGMDAVAEESDLWAILEITDTEVLMQLTLSRGGKERPEGEGGATPEDMTPPNAEGGQKPAGDIPEGTMPEHSGENRPENMDGTIPEDEIPEDGQDRGEGGRQSGNRGGGMDSAMIVISSTETAQISAEDIAAAIQEAAETLGYSASGMEVTEEQAAVIDTEEGYTPNLIVTISATNMDREKPQEAAD